MPLKGQIVNSSYKKIIIINLKFTQKHKFSKNYKKSNSKNLNNEFLKNGFKTDFCGILIIYFLKYIIEFSAFLKTSKIT